MLSWEFGGLHDEKQYRLYLHNWTKGTRRTIPLKAASFIGLASPSQVRIYPTDKFIWGLKATKMCIQITATSMRVWSNTWPCAQTEIWQRHRHINETERQTMKTWFYKQMCIPGWGSIFFLLFIVCATTQKKLLFPLFVPFPTSTLYHPLPPSVSPDIFVLIFGLCINVLWLIPSSSFIQSPLSSDRCQSVPCIYASVSILFICLVCSLDSTYEWSHVVFAFDWFISLSIIFSRSIHAVTRGKSFFLFYCCIVFHCVNVPHLFYPFIHLQTPRLFLDLGYYE